MNKEWEEVNLPKLFREYKAGGTPKTSNEDYYGGNIPFLKIDSITGNKYINEGSTKITDRGLKDSTSRTYQEGDIILTIYGSYGKVGILKKDMAISQAMVGIKVNTGVSNTEFLYYLLDSLQPEYDSLATGTTQQNLSKGLLGLIDVELPPLWEQERIASVLYSVDELLEGLRGKRDNLQETKQGLMQTYSQAKKELQIKLVRKILLYIKLRLENLKN